MHLTSFIFFFSLQLVATIKRKLATTKSVIRWMDFECIKHPQTLSKMQMQQNLMQQQPFPWHR